jgi:hypothetical protein
MIRDVPGEPAANNDAPVLGRRDFVRSALAAFLASTAAPGCDALPNTSKPIANTADTHRRSSLYSQAQLVTGSMEAGSVSFSSENGTFQDDDVGKVAVIPGAGECRVLSDAAITTGSTELTSPSGRFSSADIRSAVAISGAGADGGDLKSTVKSVVNATTVTLGAPAATTVSNATATVAAYLTTTIAAVSGSVARLNDAPDIAIRGATMLYGTDNRKALETAISAGGDVAIPAGIYLSAGSVSLDHASNVTVRGAGRDDTVIYQVGVGGAAIFQTRRFTVKAPLSGFSMSDLTLDGAFTQGKYHVDNCGVRIECLAQCTFRDMTVRNTLATGLGIDNLSTGTLIENVLALNCGAGSRGIGPGCAGIGIGMSGNVNDFIVRNCWTEGNGTFGILIETGNKATVSGAVITGCTAIGNALSGFADAAGKGIMWSECYAYANELDGFTNCSGTVSGGVPGRDTVWENCAAIGNQRHGFSYEPWQLGLPSMPYQPNPNRTANVTWKNCRANSNGQNGFEINTAATSVDGVSLTECIGFANAGSGVAFVGQRGSVENVAIAGGVFSGNTDFGIAFANELDVNAAAVRDTATPDNHAGPIAVPVGILVEQTNNR